MSPPPEPSPRRALARMKALALGLLVAAALLYVLARCLADRAPAWDYVAAFAEAAMVGAMADWFAVVALFRHPLGLPIPHTAIIPTKKLQLGQNLADFICDNFLGTPQVLDKLKAFDPAARLSAWLAAPAHAEQLGRHIVGAARYGLAAFDDERVRAFLRRAVLARLERIELAPLAGRLLGALTAGRRHQALLDEVLRKLAELLADDAIKARVAEAIAAEVSYLRFVGLDALAGKVAAGKVVAGVIRIIAEMSADPAHPLRLDFDDYVARFIARLQSDPAFHAQGEKIKQELLAHPALTEYVNGLWRELLAWLQADLERGDSTIAARLAQTARGLGDKLAADAPTRDWLNAQVHAAAPRWIERYRQDIRHFIVGRVAAWPTEELTEELERNVGRDLQYVRINGTLVGGLVGLAIHALTHWVQG